MYAGSFSRFHPRTLSSGPGTDPPTEIGSIHREHPPMCSRDFRISMPYPWPRTASVANSRIWSNPKTVPCPVALLLILTPFFSSPWINQSSSTGGSWGPVGPPTKRLAIGRSLTWCHTFFLSSALFIGPPECFHSILPNRNAARILGRCVTRRAKRTGPHRNEWYQLSRSARVWQALEYESNRHRRE